MKKIFLLIFFVFLISGKVFSQADSTENEIFSVSYVDYENNIDEVKDVKIISLDSNSVTYSESVYDGTKLAIVPYIVEVKFNNLRSFGYKVGTSFGSRVLTGALVGFGFGFIVVGAVSGSLNHDGKGTFGQAIGFGFIGGLALSLPCSLIGAITGIGSKEYEVLDVTKYNNARKYEIIKRLLDAGLKKNMKS